MIDAIHSPATGFTILIPLVAAMGRETQQCASEMQGTGRLLASKQDVKKIILKISSTNIRKEMHSTCLLDLRDTQNEFW